MKRCWFGACLLAVLLAGSLSVTWGMDAAHRPVAEELSRAAASAQAGDWRQAGAEFRQAQAGWEKFAHFRACFADHTPMEAVDEELAAARSAAILEEWPDFAVSCARAAKMVTAVGEAHAFNWWNLL